mmetsp:Transcript_14566/g.27012  ORF Transcript_14566/g.27012 Transcript_14566/m.27012 type:complete len:226 (-) Transcript_14566:2983-3660(-)
MPGGASKGGLPNGGISNGGLPGGPPLPKCGGGWSMGGRSKGGGPRCGSNGGRCGSNPPLPPIGPMGPSKGGLKNGGGPPGKGGGGKRGSNGGGGTPGKGPPCSSNGDLSKGGRGGMPGGPLCMAGASSPPCSTGVVTHACFDTGKSAVQSIGMATTNCWSWPSLLSGQSEDIWRLNFSSTTGALGGTSRSSSLLAVHSMRFKWHNFCNRSVGLPAMSSGSGFPGT